MGLFKKIFKAVKSWIPKEIRKPVSELTGIKELYNKPLSESKAEQVISTPPSPAPVPTGQTTSTFRPYVGAANVAATTFSGPAQQAAAAPPIQVGTSSQPQAMKLQQNVSPYGAAAGVMGAQAAQAAQGQTAPAANQFRAPSMQGIQFGGS